MKHIATVFTMMMLCVILKEIKQLSGKTTRTIEGITWMYVILGIVIIIMEAKQWLI
jgi:Na+/alanine symporter